MNNQKVDIHNVVDQRVDNRAYFQQGDDSSKPIRRRKKKRYNPEDEKIKLDLSNAYEDPNLNP